MAYTTLSPLLRPAAVFDLTVAPREPGMAAHRWLYEALRREILEGRLRPGAQLPSSRNLAATYGLSRGTIVNAFEQLKSEGYLEGSLGSGTYVSRILPDDLLQVASGKIEESTRASKILVACSPITRAVHSCFRILKIAAAALFARICPRSIYSPQHCGRS